MAVSGIAPAGKASHDVPGGAQMETRLPSIPLAALALALAMAWSPHPAAIEVPEHTCYSQNAERPPSAPEPVQARTWAPGPAAVTPVPVLSADTSRQGTSPAPYKTSYLKTTKITMELITTELSTAEGV